MPTPAGLARGEMASGLYIQGRTALVTLLTAHPSFTGPALIVAERSPPSSPAVVGTSTSVDQRQLGVAAAAEVFAELALPGHVENRPPSRLVIAAAAIGTCCP